MRCAAKAVAFVAVLAEVALAYYSYPDHYASFADIDWSKRSDYGWISPEYGYAAMADADWGWKKRSDSAPVSDDDEAAPVAAAVTDNKRSYGSYGSRLTYPYTNRYTYRAYREPSAAASSTSSARSSSYYYKPRYQRSRSIFDGDGGAYAYHSMADADWGWKKRKRSSSSDPVVELLTKRHLSSITKNGGYRSRRRNY